MGKRSDQQVPNLPGGARSEERVGTRFDEKEPSPCGVLVTRRYNTHPNKNTGYVVQNPDSTKLTTKSSPTAVVV